MDESGGALGRRGVRGEKSKSGHVALGAIGAFGRGNAKCGERQKQSGDLSRENLASRSKNIPIFTRARQLFFLFPLHLFTVCRKVLYL